MVYTLFIILIYDTLIQFLGKIRVRFLQIHCKYHYIWYF